MTNRIQTPYIFLAEELDVINNQFSSHKDWSKDIFEKIKTNIVEHLRIQQGNTCCYCKSSLGFDIKQVDIEHIVPKSKYENFTFESRNLALSCPPCNTKKSTKSVLSRHIVNYPTNGINFKIIHAHYDEYSDHIEIFNNIIFIPRSTKGSETITFCELFKLRVVEQRARLFQKPNPSLINQIVSELGSDTIAAQEKNAFIDKLKELIR